MLGFYGGGAMQQVAQNEDFFYFLFLQQCEKSIDLALAFFLG